MKVGNGVYASIQEIQAVWGAVSADGRVTIKDLKESTGLKHAKVSAILSFLEKCAYIEHAFRNTGRKVNIPLVDGSYVYGVQIASKWAEPSSRLLTESKTDRP